MKKAEAPVPNALLSPEEHAASLGMWIFLATETLFIGVLFAAYTLVRLDHADGFTEGSRATDIVLGTFNTAVLLTSSLAMALAVQQSHAGAPRAACRWLAITALLGLCFLGIKGFEYWSDWQHALVPGLNFHAAGPDARGMELFFFVYFVTTGAHAIHLLIGIGWVSWLAVSMRRAVVGSPARTTLENTGLYWHFVDVVWIFLFPLLYLVHRV